VIKTHKNEENNKIDENDGEIEDGELVTPKKRKRIHNPTTRKYYKLRERTTSKGQKGQILGTWTPKTKKRKKGWFEELFG